ncbi:MAG: Bax inhibitor-1/YccA family protein [Clostridiales bacterium]|nr:Bax inhibitor-1/YccA family protein [Clostridiales bacterium]
MKKAYDDYYEAQAVKGVYAYGGSKQSVNSFMAKVYGWMFFGLLTSALSGFATLLLASASRQVFNFLFSGPTYIVLCVVELALVFVLSGRALKMKVGTAAAMFIVYSVFNGVTLTVIGFIYAGEVMILAFALTAVSFGIMSVVGLTTKADLSGMGKILLFGLLGVIIASVVNIFLLKSSTLDLIICIVGLLVFLALVKYDTNKIKTAYFSYAETAGAEAATKIAIVGALSLYLDFVNIFLFIVRILGRK